MRDVALPVHRPRDAARARGVRRRERSLWPGDRVVWRRSSKGSRCWSHRDVARVAPCALVDSPATRVRRARRRQGARHVDLGRLLVRSATRTRLLRAPELDGPGRAARLHREQRRDARRLRARGQAWVGAGTRHRACGSHAQPPEGRLVRRAHDHADDDAPGKNALSTELMTWLIDRLGEARGEPIFLRGRGTRSARPEPQGGGRARRRRMTRFLGTLERMVEALFHYPGRSSPGSTGTPSPALHRGPHLRHRLMTSQRRRASVSTRCLSPALPAKTWHLVEHRVPAHTRERVVPKGPPLAGDALRLGSSTRSSPGRRRRARTPSGSRRRRVPPTRRQEGAARGSARRRTDEERHFREAVLPGWVTPELKARLVAVLAR